MVGGIASALAGITARLGEGAPFVFEACEAFRALEHWQPHNCLVTNIDDEHSEHYGGYDRLRGAFAALLDRIPASGVIALCGDDHGTVTLPVRPSARVVTYGLSAGNMLLADQIRARQAGSDFRVLRDGVPLGMIQLSVPGLHNIRNALGTLAIASELGVPFTVSASALKAFAGVQQRWETIGEAAGIRIFNDCAHHPTEIEATLLIARRMVTRDARLIVALRPQLHSRVRRLATAFAAALSAADHVLLLPVNGAGEVTANMDGDARLAEALQASGISFLRLPGPDALPGAARDCLRTGDVLVTVGLGDLGNAAQQVLDALRAPPSLPALDSPVAAQPNLLHGFFEHRASIAPAAPCVEDDDLVWTYGEINTYANQVARHLMSLGVGPETLVVLHLDKSMRMLALLLGVLKAGAAYVPIDPRLERATLHRLIERNPAVRCIISDRGWHGDSVHVLHLDTIWTEIRNEDPSPPVCDANPGNLAYAMFTSGSTGTPKLVGVEHRNVVNLLAYATTVLLDPADLRVVPFIDSISFDSSVHQIFTTLTHGGTLLVERDLANLLRSSKRGRITSLGTTPAVLRRMLDAAELPPSVRVVGLGGDVIPEGLIEDIRKLGTVRKALNYYGPTETTIYSTVALLIDPVTSDRAPRPERLAGRVLGRPIANTRVYIVDGAGNSVPPGESGEICIAGAGVGRGYLGAPELTAERFGRDPFDADPGARWYRTGDRGRLLPDGCVEFIGRIDNQFKLQGMRVEAEEIEAQIAACPGISQAVVALRQTTGDRPELIAFAVAETGIDLSRLRAFLRPRLPPLMIPTRLVLLEQMPITHNGKVDRAGLAHIDVLPLAAKPDATPPGNPIEVRLLAIWREVLQHDEIGVNDDFFSLGGDSLTSVQIIVMTEASFGIKLDVDAFANFSTVATLAQRVLDATRSVPAVEASDGGARITILRKQWMHVASWIGQRRTPGSLIVTLNPSGRHQGLFWCMQGYHELRAIAEALGEDQPVHGMRSGHLVMRYTPESLDILAGCYVEEIMALQPEGRIRIGGNCQGGTVARLVALKLQEQGRQIDILFQMELNTFRDFDGRVALIFGRDSVFNPYRQIAEPNDVFRRAYPAGFTVDLIDGAHGSFFTAPNLQGFVQVLRRQLIETTTP
jgi:amino acid adenylation domain-containing protein